MYINPFPFGIFIGVVSTIVIETIILLGVAIVRSKKK